MLIIVSLQYKRKCFKNGLLVILRVIVFNISKVLSQDVSGTSDPIKSFKKYSRWTEIDANLNQ